MTYRAATDDDDDTRRRAVRVFYDDANDIDSAFALLRRACAFCARRARREIFSTRNVSAAAAYQ